MSEPALAGGEALMQLGRACICRSAGAATLPPQNKLVLMNLINTQVQLSVSVSHCDMYTVMIAGARSSSLPRTLWSIEEVYMYKQALFTTKYASLCDHAMLWGARRGLRIAAAHSYEVNKMPPLKTVRPSRMVVPFQNPLMP